ncbi:hypothetical protein SAY87_024296 [Trapa incisa]|uniref:Uncharacterized protein n=2 Tax=Trapa TaxID=22665 RepID=A0AAN7LNR2_TRANT|nr:hypothetical protein SAY87_024296 [Trapa incisa]KAK4789345.1 hypothetical protein SAY86_020664 [Trapa natans]
MISIALANLVNLIVALVYKVLKGSQSPLSSMKYESVYWASSCCRELPESTWPSMAQMLAQQAYYPNRPTNSWSSSSSSVIEKGKGKTTTVKGQCRWGPYNNWGMVISSSQSSRPPKKSSLCVLLPAHL